MKVARLLKKHQIEWTEESSDFNLGPTEVKIQTKRVGLCGSDLHFYHGTNPLAVYPRIIGHEVTGKVVEIGEKVRHLKIGSRVVINPARSCGYCYACKNGAPNVCMELSVFGIHEDGGMRDYFKIDQQQCHELPDCLTWDQAVLCEPYTIGTNSTKRANIQIGETLLIHGAGTIGLTCLQLAKIRGANVLITDVSNEKLALAKEKGADLTCNVSEEELVDMIDSWTAGEGVNRVIDAACTNQTFEQSLEVVSAMATIVLLGLSKQPAQIPQMLITKKQLNITASRLQANCFEPVIRLMETGQIDTTHMITHRVSVSELERGFNLLGDPDVQTVKVIVDFEQ
ncbi:zinc-binding alcohol dehydrogenase family protein [Enterococcus sp. CWB-B31]|uniref:zinc-binding alcohol dehydrogenase family protein n=1 Tax=Enterococcus sp. CWB-B31 TaxID=2885159 RepID=UPI001E4CF8A3|nr:zinc-binding alcohol dehydrogenase family protein [Enterococcus sp. CWB-B31]MCB5954209.1 zinc-binding alcohol dehydrogenase family protein [Enterococcus sp. CWB-B31]